MYNIIDFFSGTIEKTKEPSTFEEKIRPQKLEKISRKKLSGKNFGSESLSEYFQRNVRGQKVVRIFPTLSEYFLSEYFQPPCIYYMYKNFSRNYCMLVQSDSIITESIITEFSLEKVPLNLLGAHPL